MKMRLNHLRDRTLFCWITALILSMVIIAVSGCEKGKKPIKVGFVGCLTGRLSDLGTAGRNGVILAVEEINRKGGIDGRPVELITRDDRQEPEVALRVDRELIDQGVVAIIGHMTSTMTMAALPLLNREKVVLISPTTSTDELRGIDDYFIRVIPPNGAEIDHLTDYAYRVMGVKRIAAVYDLSNRGYTERYVRGFRKRFEALGGRISDLISFTSGKDVSFISLANELEKSGPDGILVVAGALDTAMICQRIRAAGLDVPIISCGWAMTADLLHDGGPAVEGVVFSQLFDRQSRNRIYTEFRRRFAERFGEPPSFAAAHGYEAVMVLFKALSRNPDPHKLKETILEQHRFQGVQGEFSVDAYGDPQRKRFLVTVQNGRFRVARNLP